MPVDFLSALLSSFSLIALAEIGDKSQLVCMALAARHRQRPVLLGAAVAFVLLNLLAVTVGAGVAAWLPERVTAAVVAVLFTGFGIHALANASSGDTEEVVERSNRGVFLTTLTLILVAEFGDKTQLAVAGLATTFSPATVWLGASLALILLSGLAVRVGSTLLARLPLRWLHRGAGLVFLLLAVFAGWQVF